MNEIEQLLYKTRNTVLEARQELDLEVDADFLCIKFSYIISGLVLSVTSMMSIVGVISLFISNL